MSISARAQKPVFEAAVEGVLEAKAAVEVEIRVEVEVRVEVKVEVSTLEGSVSRADRTYKQKPVSIQGGCQWLLSKQRRSRSRSALSRAVCSSP